MSHTLWVPLAGLFPGDERRVSIPMETAFSVGTAYGWPLLTLSTRPPEPAAASVTARCPPEDTGRPAKVPKDTEAERGQRPAGQRKTAISTSSGYS